jgi:hypothetical protein
MSFPLYRLPAPADGVDQGDLIDGCPILLLASFDFDNLETPEIDVPLARVLVLTQTCDLTNQKATHAVCAVIHDAQHLVDQQTLKAAEIRGQVRAGRVFGWYYLPKSAALDLPEMIVDFRQLQTVRLDLLTALCQRGQLCARIQPLWREHLAKHFADTYSRIGLPQPHETET